jgi:hypothetical protein
MTEKLGKEADDSRSSAAQHHSVHLEQANRRQATGDRRPQRARCTRSFRQPRPEISNISTHGISPRLCYKDVHVMPSPPPPFSVSGYAQSISIWLHALLPAADSSFAILACSMPTKLLALLVCLMLGAVHNDACWRSVENAIHTSSLSIIYSTRPTSIR